MGDRDNPDSNPEDLDSRIDALVWGSLVSRLSPLVNQLQATQETSGSESHFPYPSTSPFPYSYDPHHERPGTGCRAAGRRML